MSNFLFLKKNNENLFNILAEAEKLFRDEYFEQAAVQTRRFAENVCKDLLKDKITPEDTFDSMISKIKDNSFGNMRMTEFADDLYFLKKQGNNSAHSSVATKDGKIALECMERAYEIAIFYTTIKYGYDKKLDKSVFSEEMLMTGQGTVKITSKSVTKKVSEKTLKDKYSNSLKESREKTSKAKVVKMSDAKKRLSKKRQTKPSRAKKIFKRLVTAAVVIALVVLGHFFL